MTGTLGRLVRGARDRVRRGKNDGLVSVVVPVYNVAPYLPECLESLLAQTHERLEVVLVDDGSTDGSSEIALRYAREHASIRYLHQSNQGLSAARNAGARQARGEYLAFFDSDDFMDPDMYRTMVQRLEETGSDFAVCGYERFVGGRFVPPGNWILDAHEQRRDAVDSAARPDMLVSVIAVNKVFRRDFWERHQFEFPVGRFYEDQVVAMKAYALASSFDVLPQRFVKWRARDEGGSITQQVLDPANLTHQVSAWDAAVALADSLGRGDLAHARRQQVLRNDIPRILSEESKAPDDGFLDAVAEVAARYLSALGPDGWSAVRIQHRLILKVLLESRATYRAYVEKMGFGIASVPILPTPGSLPRADLDRLSRDFGVIELADASISPSQARPVVRLSRVVRHEATLELYGWAYLANFDTLAYPIDLTLRLTRDGSGEKVLVDHRAVEAPEANAFARSASCDFRRSGFVVALDLDTVPKDGVWRLAANIRQGGIERTAPAFVVKRCDDALPPAANVRGRRFGFASHPHEGFALEVTRRRAVDVRIEQDPCRIVFASADSAQSLVFVDPTADDPVVREPIEASDGSRYVEAPGLGSSAPLENGHRDIEVRLLGEDGIAAGPVPWPTEAEVLPAATARTVLRPSKRGNVKLVLQGRCLEVDAIDLDGTVLVLHGAAVLSSPGSRWSACITGGGHETKVELAAVSPGRVSIRIPLEIAVGAIRRPLPTGRYDARLVEENGTAVPVTLAPWRAAPVEDLHDGADFSVRVLRVRTGLALAVETPAREGTDDL